MREGEGRSRPGVAFATGAPEPGRSIRPRCCRGGVALKLFDDPSTM